MGRATSAGVNVPGGSPSFRCYAGKAYPDGKEGSLEKQRSNTLQLHLSPCSGRSAFAFGVGEAHCAAQGLLL